MSIQDQPNLIPPTPEGIAYGASLIKAGELVAFPTETVYGLGANALDATACTSIFLAKGRPMTDPLIVHVAEPSLAATLISIEGSTRQMFNQLAEEFWPGPLTIIVKAAACIPPEVTANTGFVGIRCPNHPLALTFLAACALPVAAPSANLFGHVSPTRAQHVLDDLGAKGIRVLDGDSLHMADTCLLGIESTVVKLDNTGDGNKKQIIILRQGAVSQQQLEYVVQRQSALESESEVESGKRGAWSVIALQRQVHMEAPTSTHTSTSISDEVTSKATHTPVREDIAQSEGEVAPGQSLTHYAPYIPCYAVASCISNTKVVAGFNSTDPVESQKITQALEKYDQNTMNISLEELKSVVILDFLGQLGHYSSHCLAYRDLSSCGAATDAARELFSALRWAELQPLATRVFVAPIITPSVAVASDDVSKEDGNDLIVLDKEKLLNRMQYDLFFGLSDRIFRATSGASVQVIID